MKNLYLLFLAFQLYAGTLPSPENIFLNYKFSGDLKDSSNSGFHALQNTNAIFSKDRFGNDNSAIYFNGKDAYIDLPDSFYLPSIPEISICFWFKNESFDKGIQHYMIFVGSITGELQLCNTDALAAFGVHLTEFTIWRGVAQKDTFECTQKWHFGTFVYKRAKYLKMYLDGNIKDSIGLPNMDLIQVPINSPASRSCLGAYCIVANREDHRGLWRGSLAGIIFDNKVLTVEEIKQAMSYPEPYNPNKIKISAELPDTVVKAGEKISFPITFSNLTSNQLSDIEFRASIRTDKSAIFDCNHLTISYIKDDYRYFDLTGTFNLQPFEKKVINSFEGLVLSGLNSAKIEFDKIEITDQECNPEISQKPGLLTIKACQNSWNQLQLIKNQKFKLYTIYGNFVGEIDNFEEIQHLNDGIYYLFGNAAQIVIKNGQEIYYKVD